MADQFIIEVKNSEVMAALQKLSGGLGNMKPVYQDIATELEQNIAKRFISKTDPNGQAWAPLAASTKAAYAKQDKKRKDAKLSVKKGSLLMRTGAMRKSLNSKVVPNAALIGFNSDIPQYHEFGTKKMPARSMLFAEPETGQLGAGDVADVMEILNRHIERLIEK